MPNLIPQESPIYFVDIMRILPDKTLKIIHCIVVNNEKLRDLDGMIPYIIFHKHFFERWDAGFLVLIRCVLHNGFLRLPTKSELDGNLVCYHFESFEDELEHIKYNLRNIIYDLNKNKDIENLRNAIEKVINFSKLITQNKK